jgi:multisubunit Na+/H+ antiporter MnhE subunit
MRLLLFPALALILIAILSWQLDGGEVSYGALVLGAVFGLISFAD